MPFVRRHRTYYKDGAVVPADTITDFGRTAYYKNIVTTKYWKEITTGSRELEYACYRGDVMGFDSHYYAKAPIGSDFKVYADTGNNSQVDSIDKLAPRNFNFDTITDEKVTTIGYTLTRYPDGDLYKDTTVTETVEGTPDDYTYTTEETETIEVTADDDYDFTEFVPSTQFDYYEDKNKLYQLAKVKRSYYKYGTEPNATVVGSFARLDKGVASGFSAGNYITTPELFNPQNYDTWEMSFDVTTSSDVTTPQAIKGDSGNGVGSLLQIESGLFGFIGDTDNSWQWNIKLETGKIVQPNTKYTVKIVFTGSEYHMYINGTLMVSQSSSSKIKTDSPNTKIGQGTLDARPWLGSIDLSQSYININGERWWSGDSYTKVGGWFEDGVVSGFSSSNYTRLPFTFEGGSYNNWELVTKIKVNSYNSTPAILCVNSSYGIFNYSVQSSGRVQLALSTNTDSFNICNDTGEKVLDLNTWYWYKAEFTGTVYNTYWSTDGKVWNLDSSVQNSTKLGNISALNFGIRTKNNDQILDGSIDMQETYFKANGVDVWHGTKAVELNVNGSDVYQDWQQPILTANGTLGGDEFAVYCDKASSSYPIYKAFDGSSSNFTDIAHPDSNVVIYNPKPLKVTTIKIANRSDVEVTAVTGYTIYGSNDNSSWEELVSGTNDITSKGSVWDIDLSSNTKGFKYYKIDITSAYISTGTYQIAEITLIAQKLKAIGGTIEDADYHTDKVINHSPMTSKTKYYKYAYQDWEQPVLTANGTVGGDSFACSASSTHSSVQPYYAFDGATGEWGKGWTAKVSGAYLQWYNPTPIKITNLNIVNVPSSASGVGYITGYTIKASNTNIDSDFVEIKTGTNSVGYASNWDIPIETSIPYKYWRIYINSWVQEWYNINEMTITAQEQIGIEGTSSDYDYYERKTKMY